MNQQTSMPKRSYRPEQQLCPSCGGWLYRQHICWRKQLIFLSGSEWITSNGYACKNDQCADRGKVLHSEEAEGLHLKHRRYSRELVIHVGYRRFWYHQTIYELHEWLVNQLGINITVRQVLNLLADFLALLKAGHPAKLNRILPPGSDLILAIDGMKPEQGNRCLYVVREEQVDQTLLAVHLDEGGYETLSAQVLVPLSEWITCKQHHPLGIVSDAQKSLRMAIADTFPNVPHQSCQFHAIRTSGELTFAADRYLKKRLKATLRRPLHRLEKSLHARWQQDPCYPVLCDYADCIRTLLLEGGIAPFALGGIRVYEALTDLTHSLQRCQKKGIMFFSCG